MLFCHVAAGAQHFRDQHKHGMNPKICISFIFLIPLLHFTQAFFYPVPRTYSLGESIELKVNKLTSIFTQLPYKYYLLPVCKPPNIVSTAENLGEILSGDRIENSLYEIHALKPVSCKVLCVRFYSEFELEELSEKIEDEYKVHWFEIQNQTKDKRLLDDLPAAAVKYAADSTTFYEEGFYLGIKSEPLSRQHPKYIFNHHDIKILFHRDPSYEGIRIVGFEVKPQSIRHTTDIDYRDPNSVPSSCMNLNHPMPFQELSTRHLGYDQKIIWTYSVSWKESSIPWENRWDQYVRVEAPTVRWFAIFNSLAIILFLAACLMKFKFSVEYYRHSKLDPYEEAEEVGWFSLHGDVFRPPNHPMILSVLVGTGVQIFATTFICLSLGILHILPPTARGGYTTAALGIFAVMGFLAGYISTRLYRQFEGKEHTKNTLMTATLFPGIIFSIFFFINYFLASQKSSGTVPFGIFHRKFSYLEGVKMALIFLWLGVCTPLVFYGSYLAKKQRLCANPVRTSPNPRPIPKQPWYQHPVSWVILGGLLPFCVIFVELFFMNSALWGHQSHSLIGFLFIVFMLLVAICTEISITMIYVQLNAEDHQWWWRSFLIPGSSAFYMFLNSIHVYFMKLQINTGIATLIYFGYSFIMAFIFFVLTGTIGFCTCYMFVRKMYSTAKRS